MRAYWAGSLGVLLSLIGASPVGAEPSDAVAQVLNALRSQGYREIWFERTLLNRVRITAAHQDIRREIVIDPRTGEILRDLSQTPNGEVPERRSDGILNLDEEKGSRGNAESPQEERDDDDSKASGDSD
jgi:hypothetical protein